MGSFNAKIIQLFFVKLPILIPRNVLFMQNIIQISSLELEMKKRLNRVISF